MQPIPCTADTIAQSIAHLRRDAWTIIAHREIAHSAPWVFTLPDKEISEYRRMLGNGAVVVTQRRDGPHFTLLAKLPAGRR